MPDSCSDIKSGRRRFFFLQIVLFPYCPKKQCTQPLCIKVSYLSGHANTHTIIKKASSISAYPVLVTFLSKYSVKVAQYQALKFSLFLLLNKAKSRLSLFDSYMLGTSKATSNMLILCAVYFAVSVQCCMYLTQV